MFPAADGSGAPGLERDVGPGPRTGGSGDPLGLDLGVQPLIPWLVGPLTSVGATAAPWALTGLVARAPGAGWLHCADVVPPGWDILSCPQCHQPRQPPGENPGDMFLLSGWSRIRVELERHCGRRVLPLPMTLAEPLLLTDQAGCPLTCMHSLGRSGTLHHQQSLVISPGWGHQYGTGTSVLDGSLQHLFPPPCDPPLHLVLLTNG